MRTRRRTPSKSDCHSQHNVERKERRYARNPKNTPSIDTPRAILDDYLTTTLSVMAMLFGCISLVMWIIEPGKYTGECSLTRRSFGASAECRARGCKARVRFPVNLHLTNDHH